MLFGLFFVPFVSVFAQTTTYFDMGNTTLKRSRISSYYVANLQKSLNNCFGSNLGTDGVFGSGTVLAVKQFQSSRGLRPDGLVGFSTKEALNNCVVNTSMSSQQAVNPYLSPVTTNTTNNYPYASSSSVNTTIPTTSIIPSNIPTGQNQTTASIPGNIAINKPIINNANISLTGSESVVYTATIQSDNSDQVIEGVNIILRHNGGGIGTADIRKIFSDIIIYLDGTEIGRIGTSTYNATDPNSGYYYQIRNMNGFISKNNTKVLSISVVPTRVIDPSDMHGSWQIGTQGVIYYSSPDKAWNNKNVFTDNTSMSSYVSVINF